MVAQSLNRKKTGENFKVIIWCNKVPFVHDDRSQVSSVVLVLCGEDFYSLKAEFKTLLYLGLTPRKFGDVLETLDEAI